MLWPVSAGRRALLALALALALAGLAPPSARAAGDALLIDGIAAHVGGRVVLVSEVMRAVGPQEEAMRRAGAPESEIAKLRAEGLERLIEARLVEEVVSDAELHASDEEIDRTIEGIAEENGLSLEQLYGSVVFHGLSVEEYRAQIKRDYERRNLVNAVVGPRVSVEESEVRALYDQHFSKQQTEGESVRVRQILRSFGGPSQRDQVTACGEALEARERVVSGEPFEQVAAEVSEVAPRDGGDLGWLPMGSVAPWMRDAVESLAPGGTSEVLVLPFGCAVLQLVDRRVLEPVTFEQARERLTREVWERKLDREYRRWLDELRERSYVERRGHFADAARLGDATFPVRASRERGGGS